MCSLTQAVDTIASKVPQAIVKVLNKEDVSAAETVIAATVASSISEQTTGVAQQTTGDTEDDVTSSPVADRRRREATDDSTGRSTGRYREDGVQSVKVQPAVRLGKLRLAVFVQDKGIQPAHLLARFFGCCVHCCCISLLFRSSLYTSILTN